MFLVQNLPIELQTCPDNRKIQWRNGEQYKFAFLGSDATNFGLIETVILGEDEL